MTPEDLGVPYAGPDSRTDAFGSLGEAFSVDQFTGSAGLQIPIETAAARGFAPKLALTYSSLDGASPYGYGFSIGLASIARCTSHGVPRYDAGDSFELAGTGLLVPVDGKVRTEEIGSREYTVVTYAPHHENTFDVIERWTDPTGETFWRTVDQDNTTSLYGRTPLSRISDPRDPRRVAAWLLDLSLDARGNAILAEYAAENSDNVPDTVFEKGREQTANRYPSRLRYGNSVPYTAPPFGIGPTPTTDWLFDLVFDYGQYNIVPTNPDPATPVAPWASRPDPYSNYSAGFEVRTHRLCRNLLTFHSFPELGQKPVLTHALRLVHEQSLNRSALVQVESVGYALDLTEGAAAPYRTSSLPPLTLRYLPFQPTEQRFEPVVDEQDQPLAGLGTDPALWVDLHADGLTGVLYADGQSVRYRALRSVGGHPVRLGPPEDPGAFPLPRTVDSQGIGLLDLDGDDLPELLLTGVGAAGASGAYDQQQDGGWAPFAPLHGTPTELVSAGSALVDLSGTGRLDLVVLTPEWVRVYPCEQVGDSVCFGIPVAVANTEGVSPLISTGPDTLIAFADVLGAGQPQLVRIGDGVAECWPSLGHGAFAPKVTLGGAPRPGTGFDASRLFLVDLDGNGTADLVYADGSCLRVWLNQAGNGFAEPVEIPLPAVVVSGDQVRFADVAAAGVTSVLVSDVLGTRTFSCAPAGGVPPYLLSEVEHGLGARTRVEYRSSAAYRLRDERDGVPWAAFLPFPVPVVAGVEQVDPAGGGPLVTRYRYRHGHYDPVARRFRGFGLVERRVAGPATGLATTPPLTVRSWYHVGAWAGAAQIEAAYRAESFQGDPLAFGMPGPVTVWDGSESADAGAHREAAAALTGRLLRTERYGEDDSPEAGVPYDVSELNYEVVVRQLPTAGQAGVYSVREREAFTTNYERDAADPVMTHHAVLEYDAFDNPTRRVAVSYPRRLGTTDQLPEQRTLRITVELEEFANDDGTASHFIGLPFQARSFEVLGIPAPDGYFTFASLSQAVAEALAGRGGARAALFDWVRRYYAAADGSQAPLGTSGPQLLLRHDTQAFADETWIRSIFAPVLNAEALEEVLVRQGRFTQEPDTGYWWRTATVRTYGGPDDFFVAVRTVDAFGSALTRTYDSYRIAVVEAVESGPGLRDKRVRIDAFDYAKLVPTKVTDINNNVSEVLLDPLGRVIRTSRYGEQNGVRVGFAPLAGHSWPEPAELDDVVERTGALLGGAESLFYYGLDPSTAGPARTSAVARVMAREYPGLETPAPWLMVEYADGFGRTLERKTEAEPATPGGARRWIATDLVQYNAQGSAAKTYEPFHSDTYLYDVTANPELNVASFTLAYDALDRAVRVDAPLGIHEKLHRSAWEEVESDYCDTVRDSRYWAEHIVDGLPVGLDRFAGEALLKSGLAAGTPTTRVFDNRGRLVAQTVRDNSKAEPDAFVALGMTPEAATALLALLRSQDILDFRNAVTIAFQPEQPDFSLHLPPEYQPYATEIIGILSRLRGHGVPLTSHYEYDARDNEVLAVDPRLAGITHPAAANFRRVFALEDSILVSMSADSGTRYVVPDFRGLPVLEIDTAGTLTRYAYDALGRLSTVIVRENLTGRAREWTAERWIYGDTAGTGIEDVPAANLNGRLWRLFDESGLVEYQSYTLTGEAIEQTRRFLVDPAIADWAPENATGESPLLVDTGYRLTRHFDALRRVRQEQVPDGTRVETDYVRSGRISTTTLVTSAGRSLPCVESISYTPQGQPLEIVYGNGVVSRFAYHPLTADLVGQRTIRTSDGAVLQDLTVYHDVVGNVTHTTDAGFGPLFGLPPGFDADADHDYDALYRLVRSRGFERAGRGAKADREGGYAGLTVPWSRSGVDASLFVPYRRLFAYDHGGNRYAVVHESTTDPWSSQLVVSDSANRAVEAELFGGPSTDPLIERVAPAEQVDAFFDPHGNQTKLLDLDAVEWTYRDQIEHLTAGTEKQRFGYDAVKRRVRQTLQTAAEHREIFDIGPLRMERRTAPDDTVIELSRLRVAAGRLPVAEYLAGATWTDADAEGRLVVDLADPSTSIALRLGEEGTLLDYEAYVPYGGTAFAITPDAADLETKVERYSAEPRDRASGLVYYGARHFAPWSGRWSSPDPAGPADGLNLYAFVSGNPTSAVDVGGEVQISIATGPVEISVDEWIDVYFEAARRIEKAARQRKVTEIRAVKRAPAPPPRGRPPLPVYEAKMRGDLFALAYQRRGDPLTRRKPASYRLRLGNLDALLKRSYEKGVLVTATIGNEHYGSDLGPEYHRLNATLAPALEAKRLLRLCKVKELPSGANTYNDTMVPVMILSETCRSRIGGLLAMSALFNIKHGSATFEETFSGPNPLFIGAKTEGGANALKQLDRIYNGVTLMRLNQNLTPDQVNSLQTLVSTTVTHAASKFTTATSAEQAKAIFRKMLVNWSGVYRRRPPMDSPSRKAATTRRGTLSRTGTGPSGSGGATPSTGGGTGTNAGRTPGGAALTRTVRAGNTPWPTSPRSAVKQGAAGKRTQQQPNRKK